MRRTALLATVFLASPLALSAQSHPLVGEWKLAMVVGGRMENGTVTPINGTGTLTVSVVGDSLVANLATDPIEGRPTRPPARMAALNKSGDLVFVSRSTATLNINGEAREGTGVSTYTLKVNGDNLEGTVQRRIEGVEGVQLPDQPAQPLTGKRTKA
jgi:hypothetical protein